MTAPDRPGGEAGRPVVLVHGAWHGPWCWDPVAQILAARDIPVTAVTLPLTSLADDIAATVDAVRSATATTGMEPVLVGHSYGGIVVGSAAAEAAVHRLVFVAAIVADAGEGSAEAVAAALQAAPPAGAGEAAPPAGAGEAAPPAGAGPPAGSGQPAPQGAGAFMESGPDGTLVCRPDLAAGAFYHDCPPEMVADAIPRLRSMSAACMVTPAPGAGWRNVPTIYVLCDADRVVTPAMQAGFAARAGAEVVHLATGHSPFFAAPEDLAALLR